jgi:hypothetical protein
VANFRAEVEEVSSYINASNGVSVDSPNIYFRYFVEKGNNGGLIKRVLSKRWWWMKAIDKDQAHFVWTEWK